MRRKVLERQRKYRRKYDLAVNNDQYIRIIFWKFMLFTVGIRLGKKKTSIWNKFKDSFSFSMYNYQAEWEKQNIMLDKQKMRIQKLEEELRKYKEGE